MTRTASESPRILIVDDEQEIRAFLSTLLHQEGFETIEAAEGKAALQAIAHGRADAVVLDIDMPGMSGLSVLHKAGKLNESIPIILLTGKGSISSAVDAMKNGAFDYLTKPFCNDVFIATLRRAVQRSFRSAAPEGGDSLADLMGSSAEVRKVFTAVELVGPTDFTVIISGETGAGKELVAKGLHRLSHRSTGPFVPVDCGSIPPSLIEAELFGHEKGAFTGADRARTGKFEAAAGGTVFLDEVQNLSLPVQTKLLRALQERQISRVGGTQLINLDVRVLAATNEDLATLVESGRFRRDLYHRLNEFSLAIPPLRERPDDILYLADQFLRVTSRELKKDVQGFTKAAQSLLLTYPWPGNVRELRNVVRRAVLLADTLISPEHLALGSKDSGLSLVTRAAVQVSSGISLKELVRQSTVQAEREILIRVLEETGGNRAKAARLLQVDYKTIRTKTKQYGIQLDSKGRDGHGQE